MSLTPATVTAFLSLALLNQAAAFTAVAAPGPAAAMSKPENLLTLAPGPGNPRNSEGDFIRLADGRLMFVYTHFTGSGEDDGKAHLAARLSSDDGGTWTGEDLVVAEPDGGLNVMSVSLVRLPRQEIGLFYLRKQSWSDCRPVMRRSRDEGKTWSEPVEVIRDTVGYYVLNNDRVLMLPSGRLVVPVADHRGAGGAFQPRARATCYLSDDFGRTWRRGRSVLALDDAQPSHTGLQEPGIVRRDDGSLLMLCRTDLGRQYQSVSTDGGETWTPAEPGPIHSPASPATVARIPATGDLLLVWNDHSGPPPPGATGNGRGRTPLAVAVSKDGGRTWNHRRILEDDPDGWFCYTAIEFIGERVLLAYCAGDRQTGLLATTKLTAFPLDWLDR